MKKLLVVLALALGLGFMGTGCTNPHTPAGHEGYVKEQPRMWGTGGFRGSMKGPKNFGISLWNNKVENVDFRPQTYVEKFRILAKDELNIDFRWQTVIKPKSGTVKDVVENFGGKKFYERYIKEPLRGMVRRNMQIYESREVKDKRQDIAKAVIAELKNYLKDTPFMVISGVVGNVDYPKVVTEAVEKKLAAKQLLEEKATQKEIAVQNAQIKIEEAKGIAEAQRIINKTLTPNYLQHEAIEAQLQMANSPNHTTVYIPSGTNGVPLIKMMQ